MSGTTLALWGMAYQKSPIILTGGIATNLGGYLPILALTEGGSLSINSVLSIISGTNLLNPDKFLCDFRVAGASLNEYRIGTYPFANQTVAANAVISDPLTITLLMTCTAKQDFGYLTKSATLAALKTAIDAHVELGGLFTVLTPGYIYTNCVLQSIRDTGNDQSTKQPQTEWAWEFIKPLIAYDDATQIGNNLISKISGELPISSPTWSGLQNTVSAAGNWITKQF